jgi:hypothetical protein
MRLLTERQKQNHVIVCRNLQENLQRDMQFLQWTTQVMKLKLVIKGDLMTSSQLKNNALANFKTRDLSKGFEQ